MEEFLGTIKLFAGHFAPRGWADCDGQLLAVYRWDALFSILGTTYGGDGMTTFALPDLRGRVPVGLGSQPDGTHYEPGVTGGRESVTLAARQMPEHSHAVKLNMSSAVGDAGIPDAESVLGAPNYPDGRGAAISSLYNKATADIANTKMLTIGPAGKPVPDVVYLMQPYIGMRYIMCVDGIYPPRP